MSQNVNPQAQTHASAETTKIMAGSSVLDQLKSMSVVVADTGDFGSIQTFKPEDATTNPTLLFQAVQIASYKHLLDDAIAYARAQSSDCQSKCGKAECDRVVEMVCDRLAVNFGVEILKVVPGVVSTEVDAKLSFNAAAMIEKARKLISMYADVGVSKDRILIKLATTWEGCKAAEVLEREGIRCNMTLLFSMAQARAAAEAGATLISPFVGRILDWHKKNDATLNIQNGSEDPGVQSVRGIYQYYKAHGYKTVVMGASFRNSGEIIALAGCDKLTVSPALLNEMSTMTGTVERVLSAEKVTTATEKVQPLTEAQFRWMFNEDAMATEKLAEGIRNFNKDLDKLVAYVKAKMDL